MNDLNDKQIEMLLIICAQSSKRKSTHVITIDKIREKEKLAITFCNYCETINSLCWIDSHSAKCASCVEVNRTKLECDVDVINFRMISIHSIIIKLIATSSSTSFKIKSIKKRLIEFRERLTYIFWSMNQ